MTKNELFEKMQSIVDENVEAYKTDLKYDMDLIDDKSEKRWWGVWIVRKCGTQFKSFTNSILPMDYVEAVFGGMSGIRKCYYVSFEGGEYALWEIDLETAVEEIRKRYREELKYEITVYATEYYTMQLRQVVGCFDNTLRAREVAELLKNDNGGKSVSVECI